MKTELEWISVKDRLPKEKETDDIWEKGSSEEVLIYMNGVKAAVYWPTIDEWHIPFHAGNWRPTHWMPLPPPPTNIIEETKRI